ncbi:hypothetical protein BJV82DRAFT_716090 [Fennellomyces sp. T-0311]|nr:hypothetical protein BJV82DRAFT_716090 [Fennellomyces sp. T-0311]
MHENVENTTAALESLKLTLQAMSQGMRSIAQNQLQLTDAFMQQQSTQAERDATDQHQWTDRTRSRTIIRKRTTQQGGLIPVRDCHIVDLVSDSDPTRSKEQVEGVLGSIKYQANIAIKDFEALVRDSFGVLFDDCEAGWAANHLLSERWDNKCYYRERKAESAGTRLARAKGSHARCRRSTTRPPMDSTPPPQQTPEPNVLCEAPSSILSIPSFEPRMDRMVSPTQSNLLPSLSQQSNYLNNQSRQLQIHAPFMQVQLHHNGPAQLNQYQPYSMTPKATSSNYSRLLQAPFSPTQQIMRNRVNSTGANVQQPDPPQCIALSQISQ